MVCCTILDCIFYSVSSHKKDYNISYSNISYATQQVFKICSKGEDGNYNKPKCPLNHMFINWESIERDQKEDLTAVIIASDSRSRDIFFRGKIVFSIVDKSRMIAIEDSARTFCLLNGLEYHGTKIYYSTTEKLN